MDNPVGWTVSVSSFIRAHFFQPTGPSRAGADWVVALTRGSESTKVMVRVYADTIPGRSPEQEQELAARYVLSLLNSGWSPADYRKTPGELTVPVSFIQSFMPA